MFCPNCRTEYVEGFTVCRDCEILLVPELPAEPPSQLPEDVEFEEILLTFNADSISIIRSLLDNEGIDFYLQGELDPLAQPVRLMVSKDQAQEAKEILKNLRISYGITADNKGVK